MSAGASRSPRCASAPRSRPAQHRSAAASLSQWARPSFQQLGYPTRSVTERAREGGILAKDLGTPHSPEWPASVVATDREVAQLPVRHLAAIQATYFYADHPKEARQQIYIRIVHRLTRTLPGRLPGAIPTAGPGPGAYGRI